MKIPYISKKVEERREIKKIKEEQRWIEALTDFKTKIREANNKIQELYNKHNVCMEELKEWVRRYGKNNEQTRKKAMNCIMYVKYAEKVEMIISSMELFMEQVEIIKMLNLEVFRDLLEKASEAADEVINSSPDSQISISILGAKIDKALESIFKSTEVINMESMKKGIPEMNITDKEVDDVLNKIVVEINAEEEEELRDKEAQKRINKLASEAEI